MRYNYIDQAECRCNSITSQSAGHLFLSVWDRTSYVWIPIDDPVIFDQVDGHSSSAMNPDLGQVAVLKQLPEWLRPSVKRSACCDNSCNDLVISETTPRKLVDWVRSSSVYLKLLQADPEQRKLSLQDEDLAAVEVKKICKQIGLDYDGPVERHHTGAFLAIRRTEHPGA